jgi:hypothetical protein
VGRVADASATLAFDDYQVLALRDVLAVIAHAPVLHDATLAAADRATAPRALPALAPRAIGAHENREKKQRRLRRSPHFATFGAECMAMRDRRGRDDSGGAK